MANPIQVAAMTSAIKSHESGGNYNAQGSLGEVGAYQILPSNYSGWAAAAGQSPTDTSPAAQDATASKQIGSYFDKYNNDPTAVALAWNGGPGAADQYAKTGQVPNISGTKTGDNGQPVNYSTSNYVDAVVPQYKQNLSQSVFSNFCQKVDAMRSQLGMSDTAILAKVASIDPSLNSAITKAQASYGQPGSPYQNDSDFVNALAQGKATVPSVPTSSQGSDSNLGTEALGAISNFAKGIVMPVARTAESAFAPIEATAQLAAGNQAGAATTMQGITLPWLGRVTPVGTNDTTTGQFAKDVIGTGLQVGSLLGGGEGAAAEGAEREAVPLLSRIAEGAGSGAKVAGLAGAAQGAGGALQDPNASVGSVLAGTAEGGATGFVTGGVLGGALGGLVKNAGEGVTDAATQKNLSALEKLELSKGGQGLSDIADTATKQGFDIRGDIAKSNLLSGTIDKTGTIDTTGASAEMGKVLNAPGENGVPSLVERASALIKAEGNTVPISEVQRAMEENMLNNSSLKGEALINAKAKIDREIAGLSLFSDQNGEVPVSELQDAKTNKYATIDYQNTGNKLADKNIANTYKTLVEDNTNSVDIKAHNKALSHVYAIKDYLDELNGRKVEGGKLGSYFAKGLGSVLGIHFGPLGQIISSEGMGAIQKAAMMNTFANGVGDEIALHPGAISAQEFTDKLADLTKAAQDKATAQATSEAAARAASEQAAALNESQAAELRSRVAANEALRQQRLAGIQERLSKATTTQNRQAALRSRLFGDQSMVSENDIPNIVKEAASKRKRS